MWRRRTSRRGNTSGEETPQERKHRQQVEEEGGGGGGGGEADFRAIFLPYIDGDAQRSLYNQELNSNDLIVMHLGLNQAPPTSDLDDLDAITSVPDTRKGLEFFSLQNKEICTTSCTKRMGFH